MEIQEEYCYQIAKEFTVAEERFIPGEKIVTCRADDERVVFYKKSKDSEINELPEKELSTYLDMTSGVEDFGTCENCGCELSSIPKAGWGVGYVCGPCAQELRGEMEY
ncbi:hypothetical protein SAMN04487821_12772 [Enterococcus malodoratus]|jgi:hypothetical protein|uniref:hypothetical protein n=1 Tax=Enterococcus malodoratus TaxID=71451 RepID=UPI0008B18EB0|nr:hypothetical protein [Enterococcus malodoratus]SET89348.1 hypothetical protein SAMN04487821_12772 [Enterococcus malodoratus]